MHFLSVLLIALAAVPLHAADKGPPKPTPAKREKALRDNDRAAKEAMARDAKLFNARQFRELEDDYQTASARYREADAKTALETFLKKWTKGNRVGCATLYLAQKSNGDEREKLLRECIEKHGGCYYLNGAQVGGLARLYLWDTLKSSGRTEEADKLLGELKTKFALCNDHSGRLIIEIVTGE
ncbi:MAG: hypothetical protein K1X78_13605 [Verrucomicrobiaceae bacterium]|nr:hypothetical protein [Verrucomicrobiaceae bacterium]